MTLRMTIRRLLGRVNSTDSMYVTVAPLTMVLRLVCLFFVAVTPGSTRYQLGLFHLRNLPGVIIFTLSIYWIYDQCSANSNCIIPFILNLNFLPICLLTERKVRDFFNAIEDIDRTLKGLGIHQVNSWIRSFRLIIFMVIHFSCIVLIIYFGDSYSRTSMFIKFSIGYLAVQRRFMYVFYKFLCDELNARFRLVEVIWLSAQNRNVQGVRSFQITMDPKRMEQARLLYQRVREAVEPLSEAFGPRILYMLLDISIQCTRFFIITFILPVQSDLRLFLIFLGYHLYCFLSSVTATDNLVLRSRSLLKHLQLRPMFTLKEEEISQIELLWTQIEASPVNVSICGFFAYNRSLMLSWVNALVTFWMLIIQTAPAISRILGHIRNN